MIKKLLPLLLLILIGCSNTIEEVEEKDGLYYIQNTDTLYSGYWKKYYPNGEVEVEGNFKEGKKDGYWFYYYDDGSKQRELDYKDGKRFGKSLFYFPGFGQVMYKEYHDIDGNLILTQRLGEDF